MFWYRGLWYAIVHVCVPVYGSFYVNISQHVCIGASICVWSHTMHLCVCVCVCVCVRIYIHVFICTCLTSIPLRMCLTQTLYVPISILYIVCASSVCHYNHTCVASWVHLSLVIWYLFSNCWLASWWVLVWLPACTNQLSLPLTHSLAHSLTHLLAHALTHTLASPEPRL